MGDRVHLHVEGEPQLTEEVIVPDTGTWFFPFGKMRLSGRTLEQVVEEAKERLRALGLRAPAVRCHRNWPILNPYGRVEIHGPDGVQEIHFDRPTSLVSILSAEMPANADWRRILVVRKDDPAVFVCDLWLYFAYAKVEQDLPLRHGDVILFPREVSDWSRVRAILAR